MAKSLVSLPMASLGLEGGLLPPSVPGGWGLIQFSRSETHEYFNMSGALRVGRASRCKKSDVVSTNLLQLPFFLTLTVTDERRKGFPVLLTFWTELTV